MSRLGGEQLSVGRSQQLLCHLDEDFSWELRQVSPP